MEEVKEAMRIAAENLSNSKPTYKELQILLDGEEFPRSDILLPCVKVETK